MLISISDSVSLDVSGTEAEAAAAEGLWGDLEIPFLLMLPRRKLKLSFSQVCHSVLFSAACRDFV